MKKSIGLSAVSFLLFAAASSPSAATPIVDSPDTHALWHMEEVFDDLTVPDNIFGGSFTSDAILDDDSSYPRAHYQDLLLGQTFLQFPEPTRPTLTTGGGGIIGEALDFNGTNQQAISILGWLGDGDDGLGNVDPENAFPTMYTDFWFRERDQDGINVLVQATSTWDVNLTNGNVGLTVWNSGGGADQISIDLDLFGDDGDTNAKWRHVSAFADDGEISLTVDGMTVTGTLNGTVKLQRKSITVGNKENNARWFDGLIDEVYIGFAPPTYGIPGDFDFDSDVDGADFLLWQDDNSVGDLADWEANFGTVAPAVSAVAAATIPEPSTACLALVLASTCLLRRGRRFLFSNHS